MGNEAGEWIIHGVTWDDPKCIHDVDEAVEYINRVGFLPLFKNEIPGFSLEERTVAEYWWSDDPVRKILCQKSRVYFQKMAAGICQLPQGRL